METDFYRYVWRNTRREQLAILGLILVSLPFYFASFEVPKRIINEAIQGRAFQDGQETAAFLSLIFSAPPWWGGDRIVVFPGFQLDRTALLFALSFVFLALVFINGGFKRSVNTSKGILGERMLRRFRLDLYALLLRLKPEDVRAMKPAEVSTTINNEVEPIGGFIGDAFIQPFMLATQALTALIFIALQNVWLGVLAMAIVLIQAFIIPRMRKEQLRLGRQRQAESRRLAGRIGELVEITPVIHNHAAGAFTTADIGERLGRLFDIRMRLYQRKFAVKFLNNLLSQITPFFFFAVGGYLAINGVLDIGQLVVAIAAYRDLPTPIKELIDWDQQRTEAVLKYNQIIAQFPPPLTYSPEALAGRPLPGPSEPIVAENLRVVDRVGAPLVESLSATLARPGRIALVGASGSGRDILARLIGRQMMPQGGTLRIGGMALASMSDREASGVLSYAGPEPLLFQGSIRDNVVIALVRTEAPPLPEATDAAERQRRREAARSGNPLAPFSADWLDPARLPERAGSVEREMFEALAIAGMSSEIFRLGLQGRIASGSDPTTVARLLEARRVIRERLAERDMARLIEPFDPAGYHRNSTIGENLMFGVRTGKLLAADALAADPHMRAVLTSERLWLPLAELGKGIVESAVEIFADLPPGHPLFERFAFADAEALAELARILEAARAAGGLAALPEADQARLVDLALGYAEARTRFGLVDEAFEKRVVTARRRFRQSLPLTYVGEIEFYEAEQFLAQAPVVDNLLFGRIAFGVANAEQRVNEVMIETLSALDLEPAINRLGLAHDVGPGGRFLFPPQRAAIALARAILARPQILVIDGALSAFPQAEARRILEALGRRMQGGTLIVSLAQLPADDEFDEVLSFEGPRLVSHRKRDAAPALAQASAENVA